MNYKRTLSVVLAAFSCAFFTPFAYSVEENPAASAGKPEPSSTEALATGVAEKIVSALNGEISDSVFDLMTENGEKAFCAQVLMSTISMCDAAGSLPDDPKEAEEQGIAPEIQNKLKELKKLADQYGLSSITAAELAAINLSDLSDADSNTIEQGLAAQEKVNERLLSAVPADKRRSAVKELAILSSKIDLMPMKLKVVDVTVMSNTARVGVSTSIDINALPAGTEPEFLEAAKELDDIPQNWLRLSKDGDAWKFDGFDLEYLLSNAVQSMQRPSDLIIENFTFSGTTLDDKQVKLDDLRGKVVLVDFWGTWCPPCIEGLDELAELHTELKDKGLEIVGIAGDSAEILKEFAASRELPWTNIVDGEMAIAAQYGINEFPTALLIDKDGKHVATNLKGEKLKEAIDVLLNGGNLDDHFGNAKISIEKALDEAKKSNRIVFLHFGAEWCGPCKLFEQWLAKPEVKEILDEVFVDVKIDVDSMRFAQEVSSKYTKGGEGIPWFGFLDSNSGETTITSVADIGNIGFPAGDEAIDHFVKMLRSTNRLSDEKIEKLRASLVAFATELELR